MIARMGQYPLMLTSAHLRTFTHRHVIAEPEFLIFLTGAVVAGFSQ